mmetsp:Transcript_12199/g.22501  ORF Transcript_12199/g.22501 Transcript_12199/m.22501 type:complete len:715 (+) Transcript_12199:52-2196(+)
MAAATRPSPLFAAPGDVAKETVAPLPSVPLPIPINRRVLTRAPTDRQLQRQISIARDEEEVDEEEERREEQWDLVFRMLGLLTCTVLVPLLCRLGGLSPTARCGMVFVSVLVLNLVEAMPLFCLALFIPVLGTLCQVLGEKRSMVETSTLLVANVFNNVSFLVLGALVINGIFAKCGLEKRFMGLLVRYVPLDSAVFLLLLMLGTVAVCSVLYSGSIMMLAALKPLLKPKGEQTISANAAKRLLLAVSFASNAGSTLLPISSPVNLIAVGVLSGFEKTIPSAAWTAVALPVAALALCGTWLTLLLLFPKPEDQPLRGASEASFAVDSIPTPTHADDIAQIELTRRHYFFLFVALLAVLAISVFSQELEPIVGHPAIISLFVVVITFGSGFMTRDEFLLLDWDLLAIVGGTNVMAFLVRETALGASLSTLLVRPDIIGSFPFHMLLAFIILFTMAIATLVGHTLTGVLILPLVIAVGLKLQAAETIAILCAVAVPLSTGLPHTSFDNMAAIAASLGCHRRKVVLSRKDFQRVLLPATAGGWLAVVLIGGLICTAVFGRPPPPVIAETGTPETLRPKVVRENTPQEVAQIGWNDNLANWKEFMERPNEKAFAVGTIRGMEKRSWAASWGHETQAEANEVAMQHCRDLAERCRLIYPPQESRAASMLGLPSSLTIWSSASEDSSLAAHDWHFSSPRAFRASSHRKSVPVSQLAPHMA